MKFYVSPGQGEVLIPILQDNDDVNICVDSEIVAWFDANKATLTYNEEWLKLAGLTLRRDQND